MRYRALGATGLHVSEIGFGTWGLGGDAYGPTDDDQSVRALLRARELGINFFDTSDLYGAGHSEDILGKTFLKMRSEILISTKGGLLPHRTFEMPADFSLAAMQNAFDASLRRLQTDYVDVYHLHSPTLDSLRRSPDTLDWLSGLKKHGRIRAVALSAQAPADALDALSLYPFDAVQINYNLIDRRAEECGLFDLCRSKDVGIIARTPLCFGYLTGHLTGSKAELTADFDHRAKWPEEQLRRWANAPGLFGALHGGTTGRTAAQFALQFCLDASAVSTAIPGMLTESQVIENAATTELPSLDALSLETICRIYEGHSFYDPKSKAGG